TLNSKLYPSFRAWITQSPNEQKPAVDRQDHRNFCLFLFQFCRCDATPVPSRLRAIVYYPINNSCTLLLRSQIPAARLNQFGSSRKGWPLCLQEGVYSSHRLHERKKHICVLF